LTASAWRGKLNAKELRPLYSVVSGIADAKDSIENGIYRDTHCWIFTPLSFANLLYQLAELNLVWFACETIFETQRDALEFYLHLSPSSDKARILDSWDSIKRQLLTSSTYQKSPHDFDDLKHILR
jgi:hypothetical protein